MVRLSFLSVTEVKKQTQEAIIILDTHGERKLELENFNTQG